MTETRHSLKFGLSTGAQAAPYEVIAEHWRRAEAMGFDSIWVPEHTPMQFPGAIQHDAWSLLGALARETRKVRIGTLVSQITFRHPLLLAMSVSTIDHVSNGRVVLGIGTGGGPADQVGLGLPQWSARERLDRLEEQLNALDALLRGETVSRESGHYPMQDARVARPVQLPRPPILVAAQGPQALRLAARYADVWNSLGGQPPFGAPVSAGEALAATRRSVELLDEACKNAGRDPSTITRSVLLWRYDAYSSPDALAEYVGRYRELGFREFIFGWPTVRGAPSPEREALLERLMSDVVPRLRS